MAGLPLGGVAIRGGVSADGRQPRGSRRVKNATAVIWNQAVTASVRRVTTHHAEIITIESESYLSWIA